MNNRRKNCFSAFLVMLMMLFVATQGVQAQRVGRWEKLGQRTVNLTLDRDVFRCAHKGTFTAIRFHVEKAPVNFLRVVVEYANGKNDNLDFNRPVPAGGTSRYLDLRGNKRIIKQITVFYKALPKRGSINRIKKAKVEVWGRH